MVQKIAHMVYEGLLRFGWVMQGQILSKVSPLSLRGKKWRIFPAYIRMRNQGHSTCECFYRIISFRSKLQQINSGYMGDSNFRRAIPIVPRPSFFANGNLQAFQKLIVLLKCKLDFSRYLDKVCSLLNLGNYFEMISQHHGSPF